MNLIEQLGGYEKLKPHFLLTDRKIGYTHIYLHDNNHYCSLDESVDYIIPDKAIPIKDVFNALLEYRRQHNIFEVGDKVIEITDYPDNDVLTVKSISDNLLVCESDYLNASYVLSNKHKPCFYVRHATPEEIAAGKRL